MNLYHCEVEYFCPPEYGDPLLRQTASEQMVAEDEDQARLLFYGLHRPALAEMGVKIEAVEVWALRYNVNALKGRYYGETPPA